MKTLACISALASILISASAYANDVDPFGFEKEHFISSKSRAEVTADVKAARGAGELPAFGEIGVRVVEAPSVLRREQVEAETREAARLGLITYGEQAPKVATPEQERLIQMAGMRALEHHMASGAPHQAVN